MAEVSERIKPFFIRRLKKDVLPDLPDKVYENRVIVLSPQEKKIYKELASHGHMATEDEQAVVAIIRCKQFCNWPEMVDSGCQASSKMDAFKEVIHELIVLNGHKVLVFSQYKEMLNILGPELEAMGIKFLRIDGDTKKTRRAEMQKELNEDATVDAVIGT
ncbi:MAG: DEAD/DEAH box helicase, partial [Desulfobacterales bacterium]|nr:DEAD/DEAH box helicase [Desulfobacterales bacterium]